MNDDIFLQKIIMWIIYSTGKVENRITHSYDGARKKALNNKK